MTKHTLTVPIKDQTGKQHFDLTLKPSMKTKDVFAATEFAGGNATKLTAHLIGTMVGLAYEDILELDIRDFDVLDGLITESRYPKAKEGPATADSSKSATESSQT